MSNVLENIAQILPSHAVMLPSSEGIDINIGTKRMSMHFENGELVGDDQRSQDLLNCAQANVQ